ncbi:MAG TPA: T9SS type A sorting domain-containing protein [Clostridiales bacterium]|nr:T9SS type A sorting domain-containing protein [Clostridiales bacterium]HQP69496.1 T9SS type A sorting domain-containing protein [Clostridiales bacterium]
MKKLVIALMVLSAGLVFGELVNLNPDPNGEQWLAGGWKIPSAEEMKIIDSYPKLRLPEKYKGKEIPYKLDNSQLQYFRPIFNQMGGSCAQASGVGYNFTYEMNSINGTSANITDNQYPTHYTYNFLNSGSGDIGSTYFGGWDIINAGGIPNVTTYGGMWPSTDSETMHKLWMNGFDKYESGMSRRILEVITIPVNTPEGLETLKQYFNDYCDGSATGGIVNFAAGVSWVSISVLPEGTENAGQSVLWKWDSSVNHAMTFVGYNDSIKCDYNGDGRFTNDLDWAGGIDSNGVNIPDGKVDMKDWEIGAVLMANSWGLGWVNGGKIWVAYRTLAMSLAEGGIWTNAVHTIRIRDDFSPSLYMKATISFSDREELKIFAGVSSDTLASVPDHVLSFPHFNSQGGEYPMTGTANSLEIGLDISPLLSFVAPDQKAKFFICVEHSEKGVTSGRGNISSFSVIDSNGTQYVSPQTNETIIPNSTSYAGVTASFIFDAPEIADETLPQALPGIQYNHQLSVQNGTAPYKWDVICDYSETENYGEFDATADTPITFTNDDDSDAVIELPFLFPFYGVLYDKVTVITDGSIKLEEGFDYIRTEGDIMSFKTITCYGADLMIYPDQGDGVFYSVNDSCLTVRWKTSMYDLPDVNLEFETKIYSDSRIEFFYGDSLTTGIAWASGISNGKVTDAIISSTSGLNDASVMKTAFETDPYPYGLSLSPDGIFGGIISTAGKTWNVKFRVTDDRNISGIKVLPFSTATGIGDDEPAGISDFILDQNYPNPFNPVTTIRFELKNTINVSLHIYNTRGEKVDTLIENEILKKGSYKYEWKTAERLSSGVYYFGLETDKGYRQIRKMTLIK